MSRHPHQTRTRARAAVAAIAMLAGVPAALTAQTRADSAGWVIESEGWLRWDERACAPRATRTIGTSGQYRLCAWSANAAEQRGQVRVVEPTRLSPEEHLVSLERPAVFNAGGEAFRVVLMEVKSDDLRVLVYRRDRRP